MIKRLLRLTLHGMPGAFHQQGGAT